MQEIYIARQPIYDRQLDLVAYELLYRDADYLRNGKAVENPHTSTELLINTFMELGLENIVGSNPAFIRMTRDYLRNDQRIPMTTEQVVLEVSVAEPPDEALCAGLKHIASNGYDIALDDFSYRPALLPLLQSATIVKLDLQALGKEKLAEQVKLCRQHKVMLMVKKVETHEELEFCKELGIDWFQGFFFCKPQLVSGKSRPANRAVLLRILSKLQDDNTSIEQLEKVIIQDTVLAYKLLRYLNSATYAFRREINSVREALMLIGTEQVKRWASLLIISSYQSDKPQELIATAMVRARMCELLAERSRNRIDPTQAFTVGLFSTLDALMDTPMEELLDTLSFSAAIKLALTDAEGELGHLLQQVLHYERGNWSELAINGFSSTDYAMAYLGAVQWVNESFIGMINEAKAS
jgi:c-di-GMP phosphodiesterase